MKILLNRIKLILFALILSLYALTGFTQQQWKFHVAFEDATGAKDTIWFILDTTATFYGIDTALGEGNVNFNYNVFNVWTLTWGTYPNFDTTKVVAFPYDIGGFGSEIHAFNFELPIKISWDTSLLHASYLPSSPVGWMNHARIDNYYFFMINNNPWVQMYDMTLDDYVIAPDSTIVGNNPWYWESWIHFPMTFYIDQDPTIGINPFNINKKTDVLLYPNPVNNILNIVSEQIFNQVKICDLNGKVLLSKKNNQKKTIINVSSLQPGIYIVHLINNKNLNYYEKFIKSN